MQDVGIGNAILSLIIRRLGDLVLLQGGLILTLKGLDVSVLIISPFDSIVGPARIKEGHENVRLGVGLGKMKNLEPTGDAPDYYVRYTTFLFWLSTQVDFPKAGSLM